MRPIFEFCLSHLPENEKNYTLYLTGVANQVGIFQLYRVKKTQLLRSQAIWLQPELRSGCART